MKYTATSGLRKRIYLLEKNIAFSHYQDNSQSKKKPTPYPKKHIKRQLEHGSDSDQHL
jgi:hypothetical protein